jgi:D-ribose pyranase
VKKSGIINAQLAYSLARLGHTDRLVVCDAGLPIPPGPEVVDLAFQFGVPSFEVVLRGLLDELLVEDAIAAEEAKNHNPAINEHLHALLPNLELVSHQELKHRMAGAKLVVRTGEATAYSNVILRCGVPF